jgi:hypothetical protein
MLAPGPMYTQMTMNDAGTQPNTIDACGVCGGDESECALGNAPLILNNQADAQNERGVHALDLDGISYYACQWISMHAWPCAALPCAAFFLGHCHQCFMFHAHVPCRHGCMLMCHVHFLIIRVCLGGGGVARIRSWRQCRASSAHGTRGGRPPLLDVRRHLIRLPDCRYVRASKPQSMGSSVHPSIRPLLQTHLFSVAL